MCIGRRDILVIHLYRFWKYITSLLLMNALKIIHSIDSVNNKDTYMETEQRHGYKVHLAILISVLWYINMLLKSLRYLQTLLIRSILFCIHLISNPLISIYQLFLSIPAIYLLIMLINHNGK